jgi:hypothetical protein
MRAAAVIRICASSAISDSRKRRLFAAMRCKAASLLTAIAFTFGFGRRAPITVIYVLAITPQNRSLVHCARHAIE